MLHLGNWLLYQRESLNKQLLSLVTRKHTRTHTHAHTPEKPVSKTKSDWSYFITSRPYFQAIQLLKDWLRGFNAWQCHKVEYFVVAFGKKVLQIVHSSHSSEILSTWTLDGWTESCLHSHRLLHQSLHSRVAIKLKLRTIICHINE